MHRGPGSLWQVRLSKYNLIQEQNKTHKKGVEWRGGGSGRRTVWWRRGTR
jgi:hypothetical protein